MNDRERRLYNMFLVVIAFLRTNADDFRNIPAVAAALAILEAETPALGELGEAKVSTTGEAKDKTIFRGDRRDRLRDAMKNISDMWRPMAKNHGGAIHKFHFVRGSDQMLIDDAGSFIEEAAPLEAAFIARGMPADFIAVLTTLRDEFAASIQDAQTAKIERVGANAGFEEPIRRCREAVEDVDPIVKMVYRTNPAKRAEWLVASHVERR